MLRALGLVLRDEPVLVLVELAELLTLVAARAGAGTAARRLVAGGERRHRESGRDRCGDKSEIHDIPPRCCGMRSNAKNVLEFLKSVARRLQERFLLAGTSFSLQEKPHENSGQHRQAS